MDYVITSILLDLNGREQVDDVTYMCGIGLFDANERRDFASWGTESKEHPPSDAYLAQPHKPCQCQPETITCTNREQFDAFVNRYMSE